MNIDGLDKIGIDFRLNERLSGFTTFKVGGNCAVMLFPSTKDELFRAVDFAKDNYFVLGAGSNLLVSDEGFDGIVINTSRLNKVKLCGNFVEAECGAKISSVARLAYENSLSGLEFTNGIPASIGGLVAMNGGCYNKNISDCVCFVKSKNGVFNNNQSEFGYRSSRYLGDVIYSVGLSLKVGENDVIEQKVKRFSQMRSAKQPKGNSCGSVFLNEGFFAGKVIDEAGLKGYRIGGAFVSSEHANFIINDGGTAKDIFDLIAFVKLTIKRRMGIELHEEVRYIGNFK